MEGKHIDHLSLIAVTRYLTNATEGERGLFGLKLDGIRSFKAGRARQQEHEVAVAVTLSPVSNHGQIDIDIQLIFSFLFNPRPQPMAYSQFACLFCFSPCLCPLLLPLLLRFFLPSAFLHCSFSP